MKNYIPDPHSLLMGFFVLIIVSSSSSVKAQEKKRISQSIIINNGDTIINGRKFSEANAEERIRLRKEFKEMESNLKGSGIQKEQKVILRHNNGKDQEVIIKRRDQEPHILHWKEGPGRDPDNKNTEEFHVFKFNGDSLMLGLNTDTLMREFRFKIDGLDSNMRKRIITIDRDMDLRMPGMGHRRMPPMGFEREKFPGFRENNNSSEFNYNYTDKDGISSRMNIRILDAGKDVLKKITGSDSNIAAIDVKDITLFPNFSNGKLGLSFNLEGRGTIKVRILDSDLNQVFSDEQANFTGNYMKLITLPKNGIYYITVSRNTNWFVKKLIKD